MINIEKLKKVIEAYKSDFSVHFKDECYKWEAVKCFQNNWDLDKKKFKEMLELSLSKTENLLASNNYFPRRMIIGFAKADPVATRNAFEVLFDESKDLVDRIQQFQNFAEDRRLNHNAFGWKNHYQDIRTISVYLTLKYPQKYYFYKSNVYKAAVELTDFIQPKGFSAIDKLLKYYEICDEVYAIIITDNELIDIVNEELYPNDRINLVLHLLVQDILYYYAQKDKNDEWFPSLEEYTPGLSVEKWSELLNNPNVFDKNSLDVINAFHDIGGQATCSELANKYGNTAMHYSGIVTGLAKRINKETNCPLVEDDKNENAKWWPILFVGKYADKEQKGVYIWKLRKELKMALEQKSIPVANAWLLTYNPTRWNWEDYDEAVLSTKNGNGYLSGWNCSNKHAKTGDRVFLVKLGDNSTPKGIIASGYIVSDFWEDEHYDDTKDKKIEYVTVIFTSLLDYRTDNIITISELNDKFPEQKWNPQGSGIAIKPDAAQWLIENFGKDEDNKITEQTINTLSPSNSEFLKYFAPLIQAIKELGGSATRKEAHEKVIDLMDITEEELSVTYEKTGASRVLNQIDFARNDLAHEGFISSGTKGVWALTELGMNIDMTMELASLIHMKWVKINTAKRKGEPIPEIDLSKHYKKKPDLKFTKEDFLKEVFITDSDYEKLRALILRKKNIILQGAPGVGKTFSAKRLAYSIIGEKNESRICMVQFHQNYSYEDFIIGYRPNDSGGFELQSGVFYNFCIRCKENPDKPYFFIIDEINRGNLSKIFGELLMLIETDKRGEKYKLNLVYGGTAFYIPDNLHIIGMMNTADRSLAMIDYALRRRFSFYTMQPAFENADNNGFSDYTDKVDCKLYHTVIARIKELNNAIRKDSTLGKGFEIGHSYFAPEDISVIDNEWVRNVVEYEIIPLIEEYWFDNEKKCDEWTKALYQAIGEEYDG